MLDPIITCILRTDAAFAKHLVKDLGAAEYLKVQTSAQSAAEVGTVAQDDADQAAADESAAIEPDAERDDTAATDVVVAGDTRGHAEQAAQGDAGEVVNEQAVAAEDGTAASAEPAESEQARAAADKAPKSRKK